MYKPALFLTAAYLLIVTANTTAQTDIIHLNVWSELEPLIAESSEFPLSIETAVEKALEEARIFFSAMIYGYRFTYTPYDKTRGVKEWFDLSPLSEIKWGDPNLKALYTDKKGDRLYTKLAYHMERFQAARRTSWGSNTRPSSSGRGNFSLLEGTSAKLSSFKEAVKQAVREYARKRVYNKPKEITGEILLWDEPKTIITAGTYSTAVRIKLFINKLTPYRIY